jgi:plasmid stabilization system protein ParE
MALKLRLDAQVIRDLADIRDYVMANASPSIAERIRKHLRSRINRLPRTPYLGVVTSEPDIRILPPTRFPYRIYYTVTSNAVVILHIRHSARSDPNLTNLRR